MSVIATLIEPRRVTRVFFDCRGARPILRTGSASSWRSNVRSHCPKPMTAPSSSLSLAA